MPAEDATRRRVLWRGDLGGALFCGALVLLFCLALLARDPRLFWNDDYQLSILPVFADVARSWSEGELPLLSPYSWVCSNLAGEFQYGTFSVFVNAAVVAIWQFPLTFAQQAAALSIAHLIVLAMGGYLLGRGRELTVPLSVMIGLIAALNGWIICWGAIDWFGALGAFAWLPWAWWGLERALDARRGPARFAWPVPFVYLLIAGGFPYTVVMLLLLAVWLGVKTVVQTRSVLAVWPLALGLLLGAGVAAPAWLALLDYVSGSARVAQESAAHWQWIVPPAALPAFILPAWTVNWADFSTRLLPHTATELAAGLVAPVVLLWGVFALRGRLVRPLRWELLLLVVALIASMLPTAGVFRWSFRWLPFVHLVLAVCAAETLQLAQLALRERRPRISAGMLAVVLVGATGFAMWWIDAAGPWGWLAFYVLLGIAVFWALLDYLPLPTGWREWVAPVLTFVSLLGIYWAVPPTRGVPKYQLDQRLTSAAPLAHDRLYLTLHPPAEEAYRREARPDPVAQVLRIGSTSMWGEVRLINGYSPIRPAGVAHAFDVGIHGHVAPWAAEYFTEWQAGADGELARIGIDGILVAAEWHLAPQPAEEWELAHQEAEGRVYHRRGGALPRIRSAGPAVAAVRVVEDRRHRAVAEVDVPPGNVPAQISFSRPFFRGYRATLNNEPVEVGSYGQMFPVVELRPGARGQLVLIYRPWWLIYGGAIALLCVFFCLGAVVFNRTHRPLRSVHGRK